MIDPAQLPDAKNPDTAMLKFHISCLENEMLGYKLFSSFGGSFFGDIFDILPSKNQQMAKNQQTIEEWLKTAKAELETRPDKDTACIEIKLKD